MPTNKYQRINELSRDTIKQITNTPEEWMKFLDTAANNYKYSFDEQVLIYAQKPEATACADIDTWNTKLKRWISKGAKGIALISNVNGRNTLRHVFDVSDTFSGLGRKFELWSVKKNYEDSIIETLENSFGELDNKGDLASSIISASYNVVDDNVQDYLIDINDVKENSFLEELDDYNVEFNFRNLLSNSVSYMILKRCGIDPTEIFTPDDFRLITNFNTNKVIARLGGATSDIAETGLREIYSTIKNLEISEKSQNRTFDKIKNINYDNNREEKNESERSNENGVEVQTSRGLSSTRPRVTTNEGDATGQIFENEVRVSEGTQKRILHRADARWQNGRTFRRNTRNSSNESRTDNSTTSRTESSERTDETREPVTMGGLDEQLQEPSRRDSNAGTNIQLSFLSEDEQISRVRELAEVENTPAFSFTQEMIDNCLTEGSGFSEGKFRIYEQFQSSLSTKENIAFLKQEYGIGGSSSIRGFDGIGHWHDSKGITLNKGYGDNAPKMLMNWNKVELRIRELISLDRYLTSDEKLEYEQYLNKKEGIANTEITEITENKSLEQRLLEFENEFDIFDTSDPDDEYKDNPITSDDIREQLSNKVAIHQTIQYFSEILEAENDPNDEINQKLQGFISELNDLIVERSELIQGSVVYLEDDENQYIIDRIDKDSNKVLLLDYNLYMNERTAVFFEMPHTRFKELYLSQEQNFASNEFSIVTSVNSIYYTEQPPPEEEREPLTNYISAKEIKNDYHIENETLGEGTPKEKFKWNIEAIKVLKQCENENRLATIEEQEILSKYVGWGGLPDCFDESKDNWHTEYEQLKELLTEEEYKDARASTLTAFYTPPIVIKSIYKALQNMGLQEANILEPSCGTGNFFGMIPQELSNSKLYGVELDSISGRIAKQLYQNANIQVKGYEKANLPDSFFDVAIGNVPFGNFKVNDPKYDKNNFLIHDLFFAKTLDKVRPGGVIAFITSKGTLDKESPEVRKYIAQRADLLGAIRLPNNTFTKNAGTEVTSDIIFLQKRENMTDIMPDWVYLDKDENNITMNKYFVDNPEMVLGNMEMKTTQYGRLDSTCKPYENQNLEDLLEYAITNIHAQIEDYSVENDIETEEKTIPADPDVRNFSYTIKNGKVYFRENSKMILQELPVTTENRIKGMIALREQVRQVIDYQMQGYSDEIIHSSQERLNELYDTFTREYGLINSNSNSRAFTDDSSYYLLCSLEKLDGDGKFIGKADIFTKRTINANVEIDKVDTANEALILSIQEKARVDLDYMQKLCNKPMDEMLKKLEGEIFLIPEHTETDTWVTADEYLSGNVREKLKIAEQYAKNDDRFKINVERLKEVIPKDLTAGEIGIKLGSTWIPPKVINDFIFELLDTPYYCKNRINVRYSEYTSDWYVENKNLDSANVKAYSTYGTKVINAYKIIEETLNLKDVKIFDTFIDIDGKKQRVLNKKETAIAQSKQDMIKQAFLDWVWKDADRREQLTTIYNEKFNSIRPREYDGKYINFVGMNPEIKLRKHQLNAIAHVLYGKNVLLAHEVGAGKTFEMVASAMESKRLGLATKSLFVVPNHIVTQFASEFLQLYPSANILVTTKKDFELKNRKKFCSRIATGEYDAIIIRT